MVAGNHRRIVERECAGVEPRLEIARDRFGIPQKLSFYTTEELARIVTRSASILQVGIEKEAAHEIASRARKTPRIANRLLRRLRDWAEVEGNGTIVQKGQVLFKVTPDEKTVVEDPREREMRVRANTDGYVSVVC